MSERARKLFNRFNYCRALRKPTAVPLRPEGWLAFSDEASLGAVTRRRLLSFVARNLNDNLPSRASAIYARMDESISVAGSDPVEGVLLSLTS